jgi:metal-responsive CopG/Arc/MetJ family transcriptional regulator
VLAADSDDVVGLTLPMPERMLRAVKIKTSVALSRDVLVAIDRRAGGRGRRSAFIEKAVRSFLTSPASRDRKDLDVINRRAKRLNEEAEDVLAYQAIP